MKLPLLVGFCSLVSSIATSDLNEVISELQTTVRDSQVLVPTPFIFLTTYEKQFGVYPSTIKMNFHGNEDYALLRDLAGCFDNNAFVTLWVTQILLEVAMQPLGLSPTNNQVLYALEAISTYHDKNRRMNDSVLVFWPQTYNETMGVWSCGPRNLVHLFKDYPKLAAFLQKALEDLGLSSLWNKLEPIVEDISQSMQAFGIPADFDDTFVNIGLGSMLSKFSSSLFQAWSKNNSDFVQAIRALQKYAYRPFDGDLDSATIDPRTYLVIHEYLSSLNTPGQQGAYAVTWAQNITEDKVYYKSNYKMPFNMNNVDVTVSANVIYGITAAILADLGGSQEWFDSDVQMIYQNTTDLMAWAIGRNFSGRPDLALTYYPSRFNFYWFTSRILNLLASAPQPLPFAAMDHVLLSLSNALRKYATPAIVQSFTFDGDLAYVDDFLGDGDHDIFGKIKIRGEDRLCSTSMALNALFYIWTENGHFIPNTPTQVYQCIIAGAEWLIANAVTGKFKAYNVVFSGSVKSVSDLPFFYPANIIEYLNGTKLSPSCNTSCLSEDLIDGVIGIFDDSLYQQQLKEEHFGEYTPRTFNGYNSADDQFMPFWSSEPFTYASALLALTQYRAHFNDLNARGH